MNNASAFIEQALRDPELREKVISAGGRGDAAGVEALAAASGFPATFDEIKTAFREGSAETDLGEAELSDMELEAVAGGGKAEWGSGGEVEDAKRNSRG
ncbi:MAG: Nif11-like leader peptide family RiPP precursor [Terrimicrobiaceae bacterium]|nr:Nif11-like leader peptide family RiPP precursor [Terrimicrobiaceae bacterium]